MKSVIRSIIILCCCLCTISCKYFDADKQLSLKTAFKNKFLIGALVRTNQVEGDDYMIYQILSNHINSITPENCMKSEVIHPEEARFDFYLSDIFVDYGVAKGMYIIGHSLIWHTQTPDWFFVDSAGVNVSKEVLIQRMKKHIQTIVGRYKGKVNCWEVVNEPFYNDGSFRPSKFYEIIGKDYVKLAFQFAHEADPEAKLYINDGNLHIKQKRDSVLRIILDLKSEGVKVDGVGMQCHMSLTEPSINEVEKALVELADNGLELIITELDMTVLPQKYIDVQEIKKMNPYVDSLPVAVLDKWNDRMVDFYKLFLKHHDKISCVTTFGISDGYSWRNNWPLVGRKDYPLLFDRKYNPKSAVSLIMDEALKE